MDVPPDQVCLELVIPQFILMRLIDQLKQYLLIQNRFVHSQIQLEADSYRVSIVDFDTIIVCLQDDVARRAVFHRKLNYSNQRQF